MTEQKNPLEEFMGKIGTGTASGAAIGGAGGLLATMFMTDENGEGPSWMTSIFTIIAGVIAGGLLGGYLKGDGPVFAPEKNGDDKGADKDAERAGDAAGTGETMTRVLNMDAPPPANSKVEMDYKTAFEQLVASDPKMQQDAGALSANIDLLSRQYKIVLQTGEVSASKATFTGVQDPQSGQMITFDKPVEVPVKDGKVDYALVGTLASMRVAEQNDLAVYATVTDFDKFKKLAQQGPLTEQEKKDVMNQVLMSKLSASGKISREEAEEIKANILRVDGGLHLDYLEANKVPLGLDKKRAMMFAPDGDKVHVSMGAIDDYADSISIERVVSIDVQKMSGQLRNGQLKETVMKMTQPNALMGSGFDLSTLSALSQFTDGGIQYKEPSGDKSITFNRSESMQVNGREVGKVDMEEYHNAVREIIQPPKADAPSQEPVAPAKNRLAPASAVEGPTP